MSRGQPLFTKGLQPRARLYADVEQLRPHYAAFLASRRSLPASGIMEWGVMVEFLATRDPALAACLRSWQPANIAVAQELLQGRVVSPETTLWTCRKGARTLICTLIEDTRWLDLIVDTETKQHLRERFHTQRRADAIARSTELAGKLERAGWTVT